MRGLLPLLAATAVAAASSRDEESAAVRAIFAAAAKTATSPRALRDAIWTGVGAWRGQRLREHIEAGVFKTATVTTPYGTLLGLDGERTGPRIQNATLKCGAVC